MSIVASILTMYWLAPYLIKGVIKVLKICFSIMFVALSYIFNNALRLVKWASTASNSSCIKTSKSKHSYNEIILEIHESVLLAENPSLSLEDRKEYYINSLKLIKAVNTVYPDKEELTYNYFLNFNTSLAIQ